MVYCTCCFDCLRFGFINFIDFQGYFDFSAKFPMLLGAVGCIGAWFEKKTLLFIVNKNRFIIL
jgi:hypothetical protein